MKQNAVVMSLCGGLKYTLLDGSREYTSVEDSRGPFQCAVVLHEAPCKVHYSFFFSWTTPQMPSKHWCCSSQKNGNLPDTEHMSSQFSYHSMRLVDEMGHADQSCQVQVTHNRAMYSISLLSALILLIKQDMIRHAFIDLSKYASMPLCGVLVRPHLEFGMPNAETDVNRSERIQRLAKRLVTGIRHLPYARRLQRLSLIS